MTFLDLILAIPLGFFIFKGWKRGLIYEVASLAGILAGYWAAAHLSSWVAQALGLEGDGAMLIAFFITFVAALVGAHFLGKCIEGFIKMVKAQTFNKLLGAVVGMLKCVVVLSVLINFLLIADRHQVILTPKTQEESLLFKPVHSVGDKVTTLLANSTRIVRLRQIEG